MIAARQVRQYAIKLVLATHADQPTAPPGVRRCVAAGASPRAAQAMPMLAKARALTRGRVAASCDDLRAVAPAVLRHRVLLNFTGLSERTDPDALVADVIAAVSELSTD